jgi:hypothetical protein
MDHSCHTHTYIHTLLLLLLLLLFLVLLSFNKKRGLLPHVQVEGSAASISQTNHTVLTVKGVEAGLPDIFWLEPPLVTLDGPLKCSCRIA